MSRAYRLRIRDQLQRVLRASDHVSAQLEILEILPAEQMAALLEQELERRGFQKRDQVQARTRDGVTVTVEPGTGLVTVRAESEEKISLEESRAVMGDQAWSADAKRQVAAEAREELLQDLHK